VPVTGCIKGMKDGILCPVELQGFYIEIGAKLQVKGRGGLDPFSVQENFSISVIYKETFAKRVYSPGL